MVMLGGIVSHYERLRCMKLIHRCGMLAVSEANSSEHSSHPQHWRGIHLRRSPVRLWFVRRHFAFADTEGALVGTALLVGLSSVRDEEDHISG
jgi:hypothetical protein